MGHARRLVHASLIVAMCLLLIPTAALGSGTSTGSGTWTWANAVPIGANLEKVTFASSTLGWAVGYNGNIIKTTDGGSSWTGQMSGAYDILNAVDAANTDDVWAVGRGSTILNTVDSGSAWTTQTVAGEFGADFYGVDFLDASDGWVCGSGGAIVHTGNGGGNWAAQTSNTSSFLRDVAFSDASNGMAVGSSGTLVQTSDGGATWTPYAGTKPWSSSNLYSIQAVSASHWVIAGPNTYVSTDSGVTWAQTAASSGSGLVDSHFLDSNTGWVLASSFVRYTTDGGASWTYVNLSSYGIEDNATGIHFGSATDGVIVGKNGAIARSSDGGATWTAISASPLERVNGQTVDLLSIEFMDATHAIATAYDARYWLTDDGGQSWSAETFPAGGGTYATEFPTTSTGYAVSKDYPNAPVVMKSTDGGVSWATLTHPLDSNHAGYNLVAPTTSAIWVVGSYEDSQNDQWGYVMRSSDGGSSFATQTITASGAPSGSINAIFALDADTAWIGGETGYVHYTDDAGSTWTTQTVGTGYISDIHFQDANNGWACGDSGTLLNTTDGGTNWNTVDLSSLEPNDFHFTSIAFADSQNGVVVGYHNPNGSIPASAIITDDGGASWTVENTGADGQSHKVSWDGTRYWLAGDNNRMLYRGPAIPDTLAPKTTASGVPSGWVATDANVSLTAVDHGSGVAATIYQENGGPGQTYSAPIGVSAEGDTAITFASVDASSNVETSQTAHVMIDKTPPVTTAVVDDGGPIGTVTLTATDPLSDVKDTWHKVDDGSWTKGTSVVITAAGDHVVRYYSEDNSSPSNVESTKQVDVSVVEDVVVPPVEPPVEPPAELAISRIAGPDRYATAVESSKENFPSADTVVLATGADFADALAASGLAGSYDAPLLLTRPESLPADTSAEITRLGATDVILVGGTGAISDAVSSAVDALDGVSVRRIFGPDRYATAAEIAEEIATHEGASFAKRAFIARGDDFADALAAAPLAYSQAQPILLVRPTTLPPITSATLEGLGVTDCTISGGEGAVSASVAGGIDAIPGMNTPYRAAGADRYATARALADYGVAQGWGSYRFVGVATGTSFPDGLSGGAAAGASVGVLLLTRPALLPIPVTEALTANKATIEEVQVYGGIGAVSEGVYSEIESLLK